MIIRENLCVLDYFFNVEYQNLCATINLSKIKDLKEQLYFDSKDKKMIMETDNAF